MKIRFVGAALIAVAFSATRGHAQASYTRELPDSLKSQAKIAEDAAAKTALAKVPKGAIASVELERENGKLIYSYDIKVPGKKGVDEVHVDAVTGKFLSMEHENPEDRKEGSGGRSEGEDRAEAQEALTP